MSYSYTIDPSRNLIHKTHVGPITVDDEIELLTIISSDPLFRRGMNALCDFTRASATWDLAEIDRMRAFVSMVKQVFGPSKWAIVMPIGADRTTARIFVALHDAFEDTIQIRLVASIEEGVAWINAEETVA